MRHALVQQKLISKSPAGAESALQRAELPLALADPSSKRALADAGQLRSKFAVAASRVVSEDNRRLNSVEAGPRSIQQEEAPLALAASSPGALAEAGQLGMPAAESTLRRLSLARHKLQAEQQQHQSLLGASAAPQRAFRQYVPPLLNVEQQERNRALSNARIVLPATLLRGQGRLDDASLNSRSSSAEYMRPTGLRQRLADVQRNQDNSGFFESPASVVVE
jgi:hypothetical protein